MNDLVVEFITTRTKNLKGKNLLEALTIVASDIVKIVDTHDKIKTAFLSSAGKDLHITCPHCGSPTLLEYVKCNVCLKDLVNLNQVEKVNEAPMAIKKIKADAQLPLKAKAKIVEEIEDAPESDETELPSENEINQMEVKDLNAVIAKWGLKKTILNKSKNINEMRKLVNEAVDDLINASSDESAVEVEEVFEEVSNDKKFKKKVQKVSKEKKVKKVEIAEEDNSDTDLDLDSIDDIDLDVDDLDLEEEEINFEVD